MVEATNLTRVFGDRVVVDQVSLQLGEGQLCALLGPNGAGKTTTIRMLLGLIGVSSGTARVAGIPIPGAPAELSRLRASTGLLTETPGLYDRLSASENLSLFGQLYGLSGRRLEETIERHLTAMQLWDRRDDLVATYSKGMKQRLALVRAIFHDPAVIFLDEPTSGLDPQSARDVRLLIGSLKQAGRTILVCTHNLAEAAQLADVVAIVQRRLLAFGSPESLGGRGEAERVTIEVDGDPRLAAAALAAAPLGLESTVSERGLVVALAGRPVPPLVEALVRAGVGVRAVVPSRRTLEDVYLSTIAAAE
ncbi:MAG: ABC transporter ATP-binding protein [Gemmatimonadales bacterium]